VKRPEAVIEEERVLARVMGSLRGAAPAGRGPNYRARLIALRDSLAAERLPEDRASILEEIHRLSHLAALRARTAQPPPDTATPYFGHMRLEDEDGRSRDILIGKRTFIDGDVCIVDWRNAPISRVFYQFEEGDNYEVRIAGNLSCGKLATRRVVTVRDSRLVRVGSPAGTWLRSNGAWLDCTSQAPSLRGGAGAATRPDTTRRLGDLGEEFRRDKHLPEVASLLDPDQFDLITQPESGLLAVQGSAGSGKTTVALHRAAYLAFQDPRRFAPSRMLVVVFGRGLSNYISRLLPALGVEGVAVETLESWCAGLRRRHFKGLPPRYSEDTPSIVTRLKLHSALLPMLEDAALDSPMASPLELFEEIFTNRKWLQEGFDVYAPEAFTAGEIQRVHRWCTRQHFNRMDGGGPTEQDRPCIDPEDDPILLRLYQLLKGSLLTRNKRPLTYSHLVIDEVQDLSAIDLVVLLDTVRRGDPVTLAGDTAQRIYSEDEEDWVELLTTLGLSHRRVEPLQLSYRSTGAIMRVAHAVLGPLAPETPPTATREGAAVELFRFRDPGEALTFLTDALRGLIDAEPEANVALLSRYTAAADQAFEALSRAEMRGLHRVHDQNFCFEPGIEVAEIQQAKGLEFDYVVILDADAQTFRDTPISRRILHVGITRAAHQVWLISVGTPTGLLPGWLKPSTGL
jgi:DNA helicase-2/ATP-dependent DNA helicase PcrA